MVKFCLKCERIVEKEELDTDLDNKMYQLRQFQNIVFCRRCFDYHLEQLEITIKS